LYPRFLLTPILPFNFAHDKLNYGSGVRNVTPYYKTKRGGGDLKLTVVKTIQGETFKIKKQGRGCRVSITKGPDAYRIINCGTIEPKKGQLLILPKSKPLFSSRGVVISIE
jgi:hypothetical protein